MKNSQKGFIVPVLLVIIALLVVGGGVYVYENKKTEIPAVVDTGTQQSDQAQQQTNTQTLPVTNQQNPSTNIDISSCQNIKKHYNVYGQDETDEARYACYQNLAIQNNDISLCEKIPGHGQTCRYYVSVKMQDLSLCDTIQEGRGNFTRYACYATIGTNKHDYGICSKIPNNEVGGNYDSCVTAVARVKGDCDKITGQSGKDYCYLIQSNSVRVSARDGRCDVYSEPVPRALCEKYVSNKITVNEDCNRIVDTSLRQQCTSYNLNSIRVNYSN